ncbi:hypothetical protein NliqN6_0100 [Naganishia liquefaciens]|uniref:WD40 repeat domain-containing protein n=1 Tax=Naganishia liquefaciens TaxID=104408 RepID=A0A8H3TMF3_9TREE|nr:hypothetical protein NliqN6_0100 [Naganishia liquefaciens]
MSMQFLQAQTSAGHNDSVWKLNWTAKNDIISASADGGIRIWDHVNPLTPKHHIKAHKLGVVSLATDAAGTKAISSSIEGTVYLSDLTRGKAVAKKATYKDQTEEGVVLPAWAVAMHPDGRSWACTGQSAKVGFYTDLADIAETLDVDLENTGAEHQDDEDQDDKTSQSLGKLVKVIETGRGKFGMDLKYSPDGKSLALAAETGHVTIIDVETQSVVTTHASHAMCVRTLSWSPDSQYLFSGSDDRRIILHDIRAGAGGAAGRGSQAVAELQGHSSWVLSVGASPDNKLLCSGGADSTVRIWDVGQRACVSNTNTGSQVWAVDWQPLAADQARVGKSFVSGGDDNKVTWYKAAGSA